MRHLWSSAVIIEPNMSSAMRSTAAEKSSSRQALRTSVSRLCVVALRE